MIDDLLPDDERTSGRVKLDLARAVFADLIATMAILMPVLARFSDQVRRLHPMLENEDLMNVQISIALLFFVWANFEIFRGIRRLKALNADSHA